LEQELAGIWYPNLREVIDILAVLAIVYVLLWIDISHDSTFLTNEDPVVI
jgi:hypothetical protein